MDKLTGRVRYRTGWFGRIVPQVEVVVRQRNRHLPLPGSGKPSSHDVFQWRDARASDVLALMIPWDRPLPGGFQTETFRERPIHGDPPRD